MRPNLLDPSELSTAGTDGTTIGGFYRIYIHKSPAPLGDIGESANLRPRLRTHSQNRGDHLVYSIEAAAFLDA